MLFAFLLAFWAGFSAVFALPSPNIHSGVRATWYNGGGLGFMTNVGGASAHS